MDGAIACQDAHAADEFAKHVEQLLGRVEHSDVAQRELLEHALQLTRDALDLPVTDTAGRGPPVSSGTALGGTDFEEQRRRCLLAARLRTLQHLERLDTALALSNGAWNSAAFASLRDRTIAEAATALAAAGRLAALLLLLQRHPWGLVSCVLEVLAAIPETTDPKQYAPLLRKVASLQQQQHPPALERPADWVESAATAEDLRQHGEYALLLATEPMCAISTGWHPPTQRQLAGWVCKRAYQLDAVTGQLQHAVSLLEAAQAALHFGEATISFLLAAAQELLSIIKLATSRPGFASDGDATWRTSLRQYAALAPQQRLSLLLGLLGSGDSLASDLARHVAPFLSRLQSSYGSSEDSNADGSSSRDSGMDSSSQPNDGQLVLRQALEQEAVRRLPWVVRLVQCEARQRAVFASAIQLAKTAATCCYASTASDAWELLGSMLRAAKEAVRGDEELGVEQRQAAEEALETVRGHVTAARLLTKNGVTTLVSTMRDSERSARLRLLRTLLARVSRSKNTESRWVEVWMDLRTIHEHGFTQLSEEEVRAEFCQALLRVGQYRLCNAYLQGLRKEAAEQLVLAAGREVFLSASSMGDNAVEQAKECLSLLPQSAAVQEQLGFIAAGEQLAQLGLDLPPLQLQQLRDRAVSSKGGEVLEQLVADHPQLAAADSAKLLQVAAALGVTARQEPLLLRGAEAAYAAGDLSRAQGLLFRLSGQQYKPAWQLAAAVASHPRCASSSRQHLLSFALACVPAEQLLLLLEKWQAADSTTSSSRSGGWELVPTAGSASGGSSGGVLDEQRRQQLWLAQQLKQHYLSLTSTGGSSSSRSSGGDGSEAAALSCVLALGQKGLVLWERLLQEHQQPPLSHQQRRRALLLGLTAAALQALQPAEVDMANLPQALAAAEARLQAPPGQLLLMLRQQQQQQAQQGAPSQTEPGGSASDRPVQEEEQQQQGRERQQQDQPVSGSGEAQEEDVLEAGENTGEAAASSSEASSAAHQLGQAAASSRSANPATMAAAAAAAAAERFHGLLLSASAAQQLQQLVPGMDAAAALAGGSASRRRLVLQLAAAAGTPPALRAATPSIPSVAPDSGSTAASPIQRSLGRRAGDGAAGPTSAGSLMRRTASRKKSEAWGSLGDEPFEDQQEALAATTTAAGAACPSVTGAASGAPLQQQAQQQGHQGQGQALLLDAAAAGEALGQSLVLASQCDVAAWEVHLAFTKALLVHSQQQQALWEIQSEQQQQQPGMAAQLIQASLTALLSGGWSTAGPAAAAVRQLLHASLAVLLAAPHSAAALLNVLLGSVWQAASSSYPHHLIFCLHLAHRTAATIASQAAGSAPEQQWQQAAAVLGACYWAAEQLSRAQPGIDAKLFLQPVVQLLPGVLQASAEGGISVSRQQPATSTHSQPAMDPASLNWQLLAFASSSNAPQLAAAIELLAQQHHMLATAAAATTSSKAAGGAGSCSDAGGEADEGRPSPAAAYPCSGSTVFLALFCRSLSRQCAGAGSLDATAVQQSIECLRHMSAAHTASAVAFAAANGSCPLALPQGTEQPVPAELPEKFQAQLLEAALQILDSGSSTSSGGLAQGEQGTVAAVGVSASKVSYPQLMQLVSRLRQRHALLAAYAHTAVACSRASSAQLASARKAALALQQAALEAAAAGVAAADICAIQGGPAGVLQNLLQHLLTTGCPAPAILQVTAVLQSLQQQPQQAPPPADALLSRPASAAAALEVVSAAAASAIAAALCAMSGLPASSTGIQEQQQAQQQQDDEQQEEDEQQLSQQQEQLSPGDAVQHLFAILRCLHQAEAGGSQQEGTGLVDTAAGPSGAAAMAQTEAEAVAALRVLVWRQLQHAAALYDGSVGAAASEAHVQVLELLGSVGSSSMWPGWTPPEDLPAGMGPGGKEESGAATGGYSHRQVLLFTRTAAALAMDWPAAVQSCRLSAADFASSEAAEAALLRLAAAAQEASQLRLLLRLAEVLGGDFAADAAAADGSGDNRAAEPAADLRTTSCPHEAPAAAEQQPSAAIVPLHRVWSTCLRMLLPMGDLAGVLGALDEHAGQPQQQNLLRAQRQGQHLGAASQQEAALISGEEAAALVEAADATHGAAAAAAVALLLPHPRLRRARWQPLVKACWDAGSTPADLAAAMPGLASCLLLVVQHQPGWLVELVSGGSSRQQQEFKLLTSAALLQQQQEPGFAALLGGSSLTLRMAVAAAAAAQLAEARQYTAAAWLAMQACGTPRLLRVLDSGSRVLQQLLHSCAAGSAGAEGALGAASSLAAGGGEPHMATRQAAAALLQALPQHCSQVLAQLASDLQLVQ